MRIIDKNYIDRNKITKYSEQVSCVQSGNYFEKDGLSYIRLSNLLKYSEYFKCDSLYSKRTPVFCLNTSELYFWSNDTEVITFMKEPSLVFEPIPFKRQFKKLTDIEPGTYFKRRRNAPSYCVIPYPYYEIQDIQYPLSAGAIPIISLKTGTMKFINTEEKEIVELVDWEITMCSVG